MIEPALTTNAPLTFVITLKLKVPVALAMKMPSADAIRATLSDIFTAVPALFDTWLLTTFDVCPVPIVKRYACVPDGAFVDSIPFAVDVTSIDNVARHLYILPLVAGKDIPVIFCQAVPLVVKSLVNAA